MSNALAPFPSQALAAGPYGHSRYTIKRPFLTLFGRTFRVFDPAGNQIMYVRHKLLTLKDEWNIFADEGMTQPLLRVKTREVIAINPTTDVFDARSGELVGTVRSRGLKSIIRDTWEVLGAGEAVVGNIVEDSNALLRRFIPLLLGHWHFDLNGQRVAKLDQVFRFFSKEFTLEFEPHAHADKRFVIASAFLVLMREVMRESQS